MKPDPRELGSGDHGRAVPEEREARLHLLRRDGLARVTRRRRPPQHVEHLAVHVHAVADDTVLAGGIPVVSDVSAVAVVVGSTGMIGPPSIDDSVGVRWRRVCI